LIFHINPGAQPDKNVHSIMTPLDQLTTTRVMQLADQVLAEGVQDIRRKGRRTLRFARVRPLILPDGLAFLFAAGLLDRPEKHSFRPMMHFIVQDNRGDANAKRKLVIYPAFYRDDVDKVYRESATLKGPFIVAEDKYLQTIHAQIAHDWLEHLHDRGYLS
jgi:hypothetical protein